MRKLLLALFFCFVLVPGIAQACLLCGAVGYALGSNSSQGGGSAGAVLYIAPRIAERIVDPLAVHIVSSATRNYSNIGRHVAGTDRWEGLTIQQIFERTVQRHEQYVVLEVVRIVHPEENASATFWFTYIEKEKLLPLSLPPQTEN
jgi:hypothetical protein